MSRNGRKNSKQARVAKRAKKALRLAAKSKLPLFTGNQFPMPGGRKGGIRG